MISATRLQRVILSIHHGAIWCSCLERKRSWAAVCHRHDEQVNRNEDSGYLFQRTNANQPSVTGELIISRLGIRIRVRDPSR
jgi:hypothetical protein